MKYSEKELKNWGFNAVRIAVVGSRVITDYNLIKEIFLKVLKKQSISLTDVELVSGGAKGVDSLAQQLAKEFGLTITIHYPNWQKYGKGAGFIRNGEIVKDADIVIAVRVKAPNSKGTMDTVDKAKKLKKEVYEFVQMEDVKMRIQTTGYVMVNGKKILVLVRQKKYTRTFKIRHSGKDGIHFNDEEYTFEKHPELMKALLNGEVVEL